MIDENPNDPEQFEGRSPEQPPRELPEDWDVGDTDLEPATDRIDQNLSGTDI